MNIATTLEEALAHMEDCASDGRVRYQGSKLASEKHFSLRTVEGMIVKVPFLVAMQGVEAVRQCIAQQLVLAQG